MLQDLCNPVSLDCHVKSLHKEIKVSCEQCDRIFTQKSALDRHKKSIHVGDSRFTCEICYRVLSTKQVLAKHVISKHYKPENRPMLSCNICAWTSFSQGINTLKTHLKTHSGEKSNKCNQCHFACSDPGSLRRHIKRKHH